MRKHRSFRPAVGEARLEERLVLNGGHHKVPALLGLAFTQRTLAPAVPVTSNTIISNVGTANFLNYGAAQNAEVSIVNAMNAARATVVAGSAQDIAIVQNALNQTMTNLSVNLVAGLRAASAFLPFGVVAPPSGSQASLISQLTNPATSILGVINTHLATETPVTAANIDDVAADLNFLVNPLSPLAAGADIARSTIAQAGADGNLILGEFIAFGKAAGDFFVNPF